MDDSTHHPLVRIPRAISTNLNQTLLFIGLAFATALIAAMVPGLTWLYMFTPSLATILVLFLSGKIRDRESWKDIGFTRLDLRRWPAAILLPIALLLPGYMFVWVSGYARTSIPVADIKWLNTALYFTFLLTLNTLVFSLGEEIGWRGFLLPRLLFLGETRAYIMTGMIWALWHYPLLLLTSEYLPKGNPLILTALFTITVISISIVMGYLWHARRSLWVASLFHSSHNVAWGLLDDLTVANSATVYLAGEAGLIPLSLYLIVAVLLVVWSSRRSQVDDTRVASDVVYRVARPNQAK